MYFLNKVVRKLFPPAPRGWSGERCHLIDALRSKIRTLPPDVSEISRNVDQLWLANRERLRHDLLCEDPRGFLNFQVIRETMFVDDPPFVAHELSVLRSTDGWRARWRAAIRESDRIPAPPYPHLFQTSGNLVHQAYHLHQFEHVTGVAVSRLDSVLEFGGGYGGMCRLMHRLGFRGRYFIFDLPEFSALQEFYLRANDIPMSTIESRTPGAICLSEVEQLAQLGSTILLDLFLATWSLSETPLPFRRQVLKAVRPRHWMIGYQNQFQSLNNVQFFDDWSSANSAWRWWNVPLTHMPDQHSYLFGAPADSH